MAELINDYRPSDWDEVWGQDAAVAALRRSVEADDSHAFLFIGPSGVGKTTLARIVAAKKGCEPQNLRELDAASNSGVDAARALVAGLRQSGLGGSATRVVIVDECHSLSKSAWQTLLKPLEEPPGHVYWCLCTTEENKVPQTIKTRCSLVRLHAVPEDEIFELLQTIRDAEQFGCGDDVLALVAKRADGSPRAALSMLSMVASCEDRRQAAATLRTYDEADGDLREFCRALLANEPQWEVVRPMLASFVGKGAESIRIQICAYMRAVILGDRTKARTLVRAATVLQAFADPFPQQGQDDHLVLATTGACLGE